MCVLMICIIQALRFQNDRIHGLFKFVIMTNYDFDEIALTKTIDFTAFLKMNCIRIPPSALIPNGGSPVFMGFRCFIWSD